jgi:two-component system phosphate regulon sensor histidine kinase PhoR
MKINQKLQNILWFASIIIFLTVMFAASFYVTGWIFQIVGQPSSPLAIQILNSLGGLLFAGLLIGGLSRIFKSKIVDGQMKVYGPIIEALRRISKGDFSVRVDNIYDSVPRDSNVIGELVNSVNDMALQLDQMEQMRQEFISNVSHEIQSPLTSIRGFAQALQNEQLSAEDRNHYLNIIETESTRLSRITDNLLQLAALEAEHVKFEPKPYQLDRQLRNLILAYEPQWTDKQIDMEVSLEEVKITADEDLLSQVWLNLIANSIKFTPEHGKICVDLNRQNGNIEFKINDTGIGISADDQAHIFERFFKADKSRARSNNSGSGLGLSIAQKIVTLHNGTIAVDSKPQAGTTFTVLLPRN